MRKLFAASNSMFLLMALWMIISMPLASAHLSFDRNLDPEAVSNIYVNGDLLASGPSLTISPFPIRAGDDIKITMCAPKGSDLRVVDSTGMLGTAADSRPLLGSAPLIIDRETGMKFFDITHQYPLVIPEAQCHSWSADADFGLSASSGSYGFFSDIEISNLSGVYANDKPFYTLTETYTDPDLPLDTLNGKYLNQNTGVELTFPSGWSGFKTSFGNGTLVQMFPKSDEAPPAIIMMELSEFDKNTVAPLSPASPLSHLTNYDCKELSSKFAVLSTVKATEYVIDCSAIQPSTGETDSFKTKSITLQTETRWITAVYRASPSSAYDSNISTFDSSVRTLKVPNAIDTLTVSEILPPITPQAQPFTVQRSLDGKSFTITGQSIANVKASSFDINPGQSIRILTEGQGEVEMTLPKSMIDGLIAVMANGQDTPYQTVGTNSTSTTIRFLVPPATESVDIIGTFVVPEFGVILPLVLAISIAGIIGYARLAKRSRLGLSGL